MEQSTRAVHVGLAEWSFIASLNNGGIDAGMTTDHVLGSSSSRAG
jgi:hypothetical protein